MGSQNSPAKLQEQEIASLGSRLSSVEEQLKPLQGVSLPQLIETMIKMSTDSLRSTLQEYHRKSSDESQRLSEAIQDVRENFNGQKYRIDRQVGTMDDLLKRFEAWKTVGNEMGAEFKLQTDLVLAMGERQDLHAKMLEALTQMANDIGVFMKEVRDILSDRRTPADEDTRPQQDEAATPPS